MSAAQMNLKEPEQLDWDSAFSGSKYSAPPPALGPDGKSIQYQGKIKEIKEVEPDQGYLNYQVDLIFNGAGSMDGKSIRTWVSARPFQRRNKETGELEAMKGNPNGLAKLLRSAGLQAKPQTNSEYQAAVKAINGKLLPFTIDWEARNRETGEVIRGFRSFPEDIERPGMRKSVLKRGDTYSEVDRQGNVLGTKTVESEVLFANARVQYFLDPTPKR